MKKICLFCAKYADCNLKEKSPTGTCKEWTKIESLIEEKEPEDKHSKLAKPARLSSRSNSRIENLELLFEKEGDDDTLEDPFKQALEQIAKSTQRFYSDPRLDMRDLPRPKNYWEWLTGEEFCNIKPFPRQLELGLKTDLDICPKCTKPLYWRREQHMPHDIDLDVYRSKLTLMENGICPKCKGTRADFVAKGELTDILEVTYIAGQRCLAQGTLIHTNEGLIPIEEAGQAKLAAVEDGWYPITAATISGKQKTKVIQLANGQELRLTAEHAVWIYGKGWMETQKVPEDGTSGLRIDLDLPLAESPNWLADSHNTTLLNNFIRLHKIKMIKKGDFEEHLPSFVLRAPGQVIRSMINLLWTGSSEYVKNGLRYRIWPCTSKTMRQEWAALFNSVGIPIYLVIKEGLLLDAKSCFCMAKYQMIPETDAYWGQLPRHEELVPKPLYANLAACLNIIMTGFKNYAQTMLVIHPNLFMSKIRPVDGVMRDMLQNNSVLRDKLEMAVRFCHEMAQLGVWAKDAKYAFAELDSYLTDKMQIVAVRRIHNGGNLATYDLTVPGKDAFVANGFRVHNSGKSVSVTQLASDVLQRWINLGSPQRFYSTLTSVPIFGTFTGITATQASDSLMEPFLNLIEEAPWFQAYQAFLTDRGNALGEELFKVGSTFIYYRIANITFHCAAPDQKNLRGRTKAFAAVDELSRFSSDDQSPRSGKEVHKSLTRSLQTYRAAAAHLRREHWIDVPFPLMCNASSVLHWNDPIKKLYRIFEKEPSVICWDLPTWEVNPTITKTDLKLEFRTNPAEANRDYGNVAPLSLNTFIDGVARFKDVYHKRPAPLTYKTIRVRSPTGQLYTSGKIEKWHWTVEKGSARILAFDVGIVDNSFALAVAHVQKAKDSDDYQFIYDLFLEIIPSYDRPIGFVHLFSSLILPICQELNVQVVVADRFQSEYILQQLDQIGIRTLRNRTPYQDFVDWREALQGGIIQLPRAEMALDKIADVSAEDYREIFLNKPVSHLIYQGVTVVDVAPRTVEKGESTTDDLFRCAVVSHAAIFDPEIWEIMIRDPEGIKMQGSGMAIAGRSTSSGVSGTPTNISATGGKGLSSSSVSAISNRK